jgi:hypothetical protein
MARPVVPDAEKKRTVPLRLSKPQYRALSAILSITGDTIQEQLRIATKMYLGAMREELGKAKVALPSEYWLGEMSDDEFNHWIDSMPRPKEPERKKARFGARPAQAAA